MSTCNAEFNESGNHDKHTHSCICREGHDCDGEGHDCEASEDESNAYHKCACGKEWE